MIFNVCSYETNDPPCPKDNSYEKSEEADNESGRIFASDFHCEMKNLSRKRDAPDPGKEAESVKDSEHEKNNSR